ncbi:MAG: hypothetical protein RIQ88_1032, partial [Actinomycetota bacterium]
SGIREVASAFPEICNALRFIDFKLAFLEAEPRSVA